MRGFLIMLFAFFVILSVVFIEEYYVRNTSKELALTLDKVKTDKDFESLLCKWEEKRNKLSWFINHKELERITLELKTAEKFLQDNNETLFEAYLIRSKIIIENLPNY